ncbi:hypothetical protein [Mumia zhuanghuii]|uniref:Uncharacterized protein n=1 Tax=Mumia zhuanghuii TaxID=2585211 RepID=A0A5C4MFT1_9ACTN|nr:hypothetical protein [Mumia zhuanghuii]TNC35597.1 hypothetical protein FHE65_26990 [Mumia zhuanghuii]
MRPRGQSGEYDKLAGVLKRMLALHVPSGRAAVVQSKTATGLPTFDGPPKRHLTERRPCMLAAQPERCKWNVQWVFQRALWLWLSLKQQLWQWRRRGTQSQSQ